MKKVFESNLFLIAGLIVLGVGSYGFYNSAIKPRFGGN